jgi:hypothetical protein
MEQGNATGRKWVQGLMWVTYRFKQQYDIHDNAAQRKFRSTNTATANYFCKEFKKSIL